MVANGHELVALHAQYPSLLRTQPLLLPQQRQACFVHHSLPQPRLILC